MNGCSAPECAFAASALGSAQKNTATPNSESMDFKDFLWFVSAACERWSRHHAKNPAIFFQMIAMHTYAGQGQTVPKWEIGRLRGYVYKKRNGKRGRLLLCPAL